MRLQQAAAMLSAAELVLAEADDAATPGVVGALAVLAGIAAADAACCARLGERSRAQDHQAACALLARVEPEGKRMAEDLRELLARKDDAHYGVSLVGAPTARAMVRRATALVEGATRILS